MSIYGSCRNADEIFGALQVLVIGKLSQAVVVAAAAYRDQGGFQQLTGIERTAMVEDSGSWDTQVCLLSKISRLVRPCLALYVALYRTLL